MTSQEKKDYIFSHEINFGFNWIEALFGDIQTFVDGISQFASKGDDPPKDPLRGSGNLSLPILVCTALEFISSLYSGEPKVKDNTKYNATENVEKFIKNYYPVPYQEIPRIFWDGVRNGLTHRFFPNSFKYKGKIVDFSFFVDPKDEPSQISKTPDGFRIWINSITEVETLREAVKSYRKELENSEDLQDKFIKVFESVKEVQDYSKNQEIGSETEKILKKLSPGVPLYLDLDSVPTGPTGAPTVATKSPIGPTGLGPSKFR